MKSYVLAFSNIWPCRKKVKVNPRSLPEQSWYYCHATYQISMPSVHWFQWRFFLEIFTVYRHDGHVGHVTLTIWTNFRSLSPRWLYIKLVTIGQWLLRRCLKLLYYESPGFKVKDWPWPLVFRHLHILVKITKYTTCMQMDRQMDGQTLMGIT